MNPTANEQQHNSVPDHPDLFFAHLQGNVSKLFLDYIRNMCNNVLTNLSVDIH